MNSVRSLAILVLTVLPLAVGCGPTAASGPAGATIAPASTELFLSVRTDSGSDQWQRAAKLFEAFPDGDKAIQGVLDQLGAQGIDFARDIEPALGPETDIVGLDLGNEEFVGLTQPDDTGKLKALLAKADEELFTRDVDGWMAFADSTAVLDRFEAAREDGTLAGSSDFEDAIAEVDQEALAVFYLKGGGLQGTIQKEENLPPGALGALFPEGKAPSLAMSLKAEENGLRIAGAAKLAADEGGFAPENFKAELPDQVPGGALVYMGFNDLESSLSALRDVMGEGAPDFDRDLARIEASLGVSLEEDVFPLFSGETALYVRPGFLIPEVTLVTQVDDENAAMATVGKLVAGLSEYLPAAQGVRDVDIDGVQAKEIPVSPPVSLYWAAFDGHLVLSSSRDGIAQLRKSDERLADDRDFRDALERAGVPEETNGFVYVNLHDAIPYVLGLAGEAVPATVRANLEPLDQLVLYGSKDGRTLKFAGFLGVD
jgi:Protein of unknown function (DUF3352)